MLRRVLLLSVSFTLVGCSTLAELSQAPQIDAPVSFSATPDAVLPAPTDWVASFNDTVLTALVAEAMDANPSVAAAEASLAAARASARASGAGRLPSLSANAGASNSDTQIGSVDAYNFGLNVSWEADVWGRLSDRARAGALGAEASEADLAAARLSIAGATAQAWYGLVEARLQTELSLRDVDTRARQLEIVDRRFARGVARSSDVRTARSALASAQAGLTQRVRFEAAAARTLEALLGRYPGNQISRVGDLPALGAVPDAGDPETLLRRRPDVIAAELRLAAAGYSAEAARKALYPGLSLGAGLSSQVSDPADLFDTDFLVETISASVLAPIFSGGALRAERDRSAAVARQLSASYLRTALTALREAEDALYADQTLAERVTALDTARLEAEAALELVERQYGSGVATIFELIDAQSRLINAESQLISARRDRADNRTQLYLAIGGEFAAGGGGTSER